MKRIIKLIRSYYENMLFKLDQYAASVGQRLRISENHYKMSGIYRCTTTGNTWILVKIKSMFP